MKKLNSNQWIGIVFGLGIFILLASQFFNADSNSTASKAEAAASLDTFVPSGFRLVPIQISNLESVRGLIEANAFVDLLQPKAKLTVARAVRLIKSAASSDIFAILVPEEQVSEILKHGDEFFVVVRSREDQTDNAVPNSNRRIIWEE